MKSITFIDTEIRSQKRFILDIGAIKDDGNIFHANFVNQFIEFIKDSNFICGHNILNHDIKIP